MIEFDIVPHRTVSFDRDHAHSGQWEKFFRDQQQHILAPITLQHEVVGFLSLGSKVAGSAFTAAERSFVRKCSTSQLRAKKMLAATGSAPAYSTPAGCR